MAIVLGIDAAWTATQPSGVALVDTLRPDSKCVAAVPSYSAFLEVADGGVVDWEGRHLGNKPPVAELLSACEVMAGKAVDVIAIDMPISNAPIIGRRAADQAVSREFGGRWCSTHTPNTIRPGPLGARLTEAFLSLGYPVATTETQAGTLHRLIEVYPHPALLALLGRDRRVPYKVAKVRKYWPNEPAEVRTALVLAELHAIEAGLTAALGQLPFTVPRSDAPVLQRVLKSFEDTLDAVVCAWVGCLYLQGKAVPLGDASAVVWCPTAALR